MKQALQIVALQHELSMAIGDKLELEDMLRHFMRVCITRLSLTGVHIFLFHGKSNQPVSLAQESNQPFLKHYVSIPERLKGKKWKSHPQLKSIAEAIVNHASNFEIEQIEKNHFYSTSIPDQGVLILESKIPISKIILQSLQQIVEKLATSCLSCIAHAELKKEIRARELAEDIITHQAHHDELTQLQNRRKLSSDLSNCLIKCKQSGTFGSLIFIDLNNFKTVNDIMGHEVGDQLLKLVGMRLSALKKDNETIARFGGDEFVVLLPEIGNSAEVAEVTTIAFIHRINAALSEPIVLSKTQFSIDSCIGFDIFPAKDNIDIDILRNADMAMYEAKECKNRNYMRFSEKMAINLNRKLSYIDELKKSALKKEFTLYYQPQVNEKQEIIGAEALLRWDHPVHGEDSPSIYVPIAEETNLINQIGEYVIETACIHIKQLEDQGLPISFERVSVNVSGNQLNTSNLVNYIRSVLEKTKMTPSLLGIELTENVFIQNFEKVRDVIFDLNSLGIKCSIDDFGTGYSSLSYLKRLPAHAIKIDRSFVSNIHNDPDIRSIAEMIINLSDNLAMKTIAEGIESKEELACIHKLGCNNFQGFHFYNPMPFNQFRKLLGQKKRQKV